MLKKFLLSIVVLFIILYSSISYYASIHYRKLLRNELAKLKSDNFEISYDNLSITSLFTKPTIKIDNLQIKRNINNQITELKISHVLVKSNLFLDKFDIEFPDEIFGNNFPYKYLIKYENPIRAEFKYNKTFLFDNFIDSSNLFLNLNYMIINNGSYFVKDLENDKIDFYGSYNSINLDQSIINQDRELILSLSSEADQLKNQTNQKILAQIVLNLTHKDNAPSNEFKEYNVKMSQLLIELDKFILEIKGEINGSADESTPNGEINLKIENINDLSKFIVGNISFENEAKMLKIIDLISNKKSNNVDEIVIKREKYGSFLFNDRNFIDILMAYNSSYENK